MLVILILTRGLGFPQSIEIDLRPDKKFRQGFIDAPAVAEGSENKQWVLLLGCSEDSRQDCSLYEERVEVCSRVRSEGQFSWFAHLLGGAVYRGHVQYPNFAPDSSEVAVGFFGLFVSCVQNLP